MHSILILILWNYSKVNQLNLVALYSEIVRLDIFVKEFRFWMKHVNSVEHLQYNLDNANRTFCLIDCQNIFLNTLINKFWLYDRSLVEVCLAEVFWYKFIKTNEIWDFLVIITLTINAGHWETIAYPSDFKCHLLWRITFMMIKIDYPIGATTKLLLKYISLVILKDFSIIRLRLIIFTRHWSFTTRCFSSWSNILPWCNLRRRYLRLSYYWWGLVRHNLIFKRLRHFFVFFR